MPGCLLPAARAKPLFDRLSSLGLILVVVLLVVVNFSKVLSVFGTRAIVAGLLFIAFGYAVGWALGGPTADTRLVLGVGTAQRNIAAALVVGGQSFSDPSVVVMVVVVAIASLLVLLPTSRVLSRKGLVTDRSRRMRHAGLEPDCTAISRTARPTSAASATAS